MIDNKILIGILIVLAVVAGVAAYTQQAEQDNGSNFNSSNGPGPNNYFLNVENNYNVLNVVVINVLNQYIGIFYVELTQIEFNDPYEGYFDFENHSFNIPSGSYVSIGNNASEENFFFSEIYQTDNQTSFGFIVVYNLDYNAEDLVNDFTQDKNINISKFDLKRIGTSEDVTIYKFEDDGVIYYIYDDGVDIVIIIMDNDDDYLFMYLTDFSSNGEIDQSNPYYEDYDTTNSTEDYQSQDEYQKDPYYDEGYDDPYYDY